MNVVDSHYQRRVEVKRTAEAGPNQEEVVKRIVSVMAVLAVLLCGVYVAYVSARTSAAIQRRKTAMSGALDRFKAGLASRNYSALYRDSAPGLRKAISLGEFESRLAKFNGAHGDCVSTETVFADVVGHGFSSIDKDRPRIGPSDAFRVTMTFKKRLASSPDVSLDPVGGLAVNDSDYPPGPGTTIPLSMEFEWQDDLLHPLRFALLSPTAPIEIP